MGRALTTTLTHSVFFMELYKKIQRESEVFELFKINYFGLHCSSSHFCKSFLLLNLMNKKPEPSQRPLKRSATQTKPENVPFRIAYQFYFFALGLVLLVLSIIAINAILDAFDDYSMILENWREQPLLELRPSMTSCSSNELTLSRYVWPGTDGGCDCREISVLPDSFVWERPPKRKFFDNHECNSTQRAYSCINVPPLNPINFDIIPDNFSQPLLLCGVRDINNSFYESYAKSNQCPEGRKKCGSDPDTFHCVSTVNKCPISEISLKSLQSIPEAEQLTYGQETLQIVRQKDSARALSQLKVSEGGVCVKTNVLSITSGRSDYLLMRNKKQDCPKDSRFSEIIKFDEYKFYQINNNLKLQNDLKDYEISPKYFWGLYQRGYILWKMECREYLERFKDAESVHNSIFDQQVSLLAISIVFFVVISVIFSVVSGLNIYGYDWPCIKGKGTEESNYIFYMEIALKVILQLAEAIIILISYAKVEEQLKFYQVLMDKSCSDEQTLGTINFLQDTLQEKVQNYNLGIIIIFFVSTFFDLCIATYLFSKFLIARRQKINQMQASFQAQEFDPIPQANHFDDKNGPMGNQGNNPYHQQPQVQSSPFQAQQPFHQQPQQPNYMPMTHNANQLPPQYPAPQAQPLNDVVQGGIQVQRSPFG